MYLLFGIFLIICFVLVLLQLYRKKCIIRKLCKMNFCQKICLLNELLVPFGFSYRVQQDIITTTLEAPQRQFGYRSLFDKTAMHFNMVFDCEPIFFYYKGRTYRIELWKGQYGINIGGEIGIYYADGLLTVEQFDTAHFHSVSDEEFPLIKMSLYHKGHKLFDNSKRHWWLTGFCMGKHCEPENLTMWVSITYLDQEMLLRFVDSLLHIGYRKCDITICDQTVSFMFSCPHTKQPRITHRLTASWAQWKNRIFCRLFLYVTRPFSCTLDRILYLYFFLPFAFRHMLSCKRNRKQKFHKRKKAVNISGL